MRYYVMSPDTYEGSEEQDNKEWLSDYDGKDDLIYDHEELFNIDLPPNDLVYSLSVKQDYSEVIDGSTHKFRYVDHRTTRTKSVVLEFESLDGKFTAVMFCNVQLESSRGTHYSAGDRGQFIPPKGARGKFRKFWMSVVGKPPRRWCCVHKELRSAFKGITFTGKVVRAITNKGEPYFKIID